MRPDSNVRFEPARRAGREVWWGVATPDRHHERGVAHRIVDHDTIEPEHVSTISAVITSVGATRGDDRAVLHGDDVVGVATGLVQVVEHHHDRAPLRRG